MKALDAIAAFYETLTPDSLSRLVEFYADDTRFTDPFNDVVGLAAIERIFRHMYAQVEAPRFEVVTRLGDVSEAMLGWVFRFRRGARVFAVHGVSHLVFGADGRVAVHRDYWDPAAELYAKLPLVGGIFRWLVGRLSATGH